MWYNETLSQTDQNYISQWKRNIDNRELFHYNTIQTREVCIEMDRCLEKAMIGTSICFCSQGGSVVTESAFGKTKR